LNGTHSGEHFPRSPVTGQQKVALWCLQSRVFSNLTVALQPGEQKLLKTDVSPELRVSAEWPPVRNADYSSKLISSG
jgi:hypothetical protein